MKRLALSFQGAPFYSPFAIRHSPFATRHYPFGPRHFTFYRYFFLFQDFVSHI
jgi:hypothetical protein